MEITRRHLVIAGLLLGAVLAALALDRVIVTNRERVTAVIQDMAGACRVADVDRLMAHVAVDYDDGNMNREQLRLLAAAFFKLYGAAKVRVRQTVVQTNGSEAGADVEVVADTEQRSLMGASQWRLDFRRGIDGEWRVTSVRPLRVGLTEVSGWGELLRAGGLR